MSRKRRTDDTSRLTPLMLQILLALSEEDRHGYAIMQEIERRVGERVPIGAGTLYRTIKQLVDAALISEVRPRPVVHSQRRYYRLTAAGRKRAASEARKLDAVVQWARAAAVLDEGRA